MRKNYFFLWLSLLMMVSGKASAWSFDIPAENEVLATDYGYTLYKYYDFFNAMCSPTDYFTDGEGNQVNGDGCLTLSADKAAFKLNGFDAFQVLKPVEMNNFYIQIGMGAINLRGGVGKDGLHNYGSGSRFLAIADVKAGQIVVCQWGVNGTRASICQPSDKISGATACAWKDISDTIHARQIVLGTTKEWQYDPEFPGDEDKAIEVEIPGKADNFSYWQAESDGHFVIELQRDIAIQGIQIWLDASAEEMVTSPTMKLVAVNEDERAIELNSGESTLGNECSVWYGIEDEPALLLEDTEEELSRDTIYVMDEEGNPTSEIADIKITYKQKLSSDWETAGIAGSNKYENTPIYVGMGDDADGDGYVTIHAATVSSKGNFSDVVDFKVGVGTIALNVPTMTLIGLDGTRRSYQLGWVNNTLCGEDYTLRAIVDGAEQDAQVGDVFEAESSIGAYVAVDGYTEGELLEADVMNKDVAYMRKNKEAAEADKHDWDFVHLSDVQYQMIHGTYSDSIAYIRPNVEDEERMDTTFYTRDEFASLVAEGTLGEADGVAWNPKDCGWYYDATRSRATLNVVEGGLDANSNGYGYVEDKDVQLFNNGLSVACAPNANNASCIFIYDNNDLGCYFMSRPTLTFSREAAQWGEYVLIYQGAGGSNYTNSRWPSLYEVPESELLSVTLQSGGIHVFYIDVYTTEELPVDGVEGIMTADSQHAKAIYDLSGRRVSKAVKGIYLINGKKVVK